MNTTRQVLPDRFYKVDLQQLKLCKIFLRFSLEKFCPPIFTFLNCKKAVLKTWFTLNPLPTKHVVTAPLQTFDCTPAWKLYGPGGWYFYHSFDMASVHSLVLCISVDMLISNMCHIQRPAILSSYIESGKCMNKNW